MKGAVTRQEILSQPDVWEACLGGSDPGDEDMAQRILGGALDRILFVGCGSSYYLALVLAAFVRHRTGVRVLAVPAGEVWLHPELELDRGARLLAICISRSGRTSEVLLAREHLARAYGAETVALTCDPESTLAATCDHRLVVPEAQERGVVMTRSFTGMYLRLARLFAAGSLRRLPEVARVLLREQGSRFEALGTRPETHRYVFLASGGLHGFAREAALKVGEMSLAPAEAYHALEFRHGPVAAAGGGTLLALWVTEAGRTHEVRLAAEVRALGADVVVLGGVESPDVPLEGEEYALAAMPLIHLLALSRGLVAGEDPDRPRIIGHVVEL